MGYPVYNNVNIRERPRYEIIKGIGCDMGYPFWGGGGNNVKLDISKRGPGMKPKLEVCWQAFINWLCLSVSRHCRPSTQTSPDLEI